MSQSYSTEPVPTGLVRIHLSPSSHGSLDIALFYAGAPSACDLFLESGIKGVYDGGSGVKRVVKDCLVQFDGSGAGGGKVSYGEGVLSTVRSERETTSNVK